MEPQHLGTPIEEYQNQSFDIVSTLELVLHEVKTKKNADPKSEQTRYWAVVYTDLEKTLAYVKTYLGGSE